MEISEIVAKRLRQARQQVGWSQEESARRLGIAREYLNRLERGRQAVPLRLLRRIADLYGYPVNWFYGLSEPTGTFSLLLRSAETASLSHETMCALRKFVDLCEEVSHLRKLLGETVYPLPSYPVDLEGLDRRAIDQAAAQLARVERAQLGLGDACAWHLPETLESLGVAIFRLPMEQELSGAMAYDTEKGAFILVNSKDHPTRQLWTVAHEYGHLLVERDKGYRLPEIVNMPMKKSTNHASEYFANRFACHLLIPEEQVRIQFARKPLSVEAIIEGRRLFGVSYPALLYRLHELGYLAEHWVMRLLETANLTRLEETLFGGLPAMPYDIQVPSPLLRRLALQAAKRGEITLSYAGELLEISPVEVQEIIAEMEIAEDEGKPRGSRRRHRDAI